jgi:hypothetical protein
MPRLATVHKSVRRRTAVAEPHSRPSPFAPRAPHPQAGRADHRRSPNGVAAVPQAHVMPMPRLGLPWRAQLPLPGVLAYLTVPFFLRTQEQRRRFPSPSPAIGATSASSLSGSFPQPPKTCSSFPRPRRCLPAHLLSSTTALLAGARLPAAAMAWHRRAPHRPLFRPIQTTRIEL